MINCAEKTVDECYDNWDLSAGDINDIKSALEEAFMAGAMCGGMDRDVFYEALDYFKKEEVDGKIKSQKHVTNLSVVDAID